MQAILIQYLKEISGLTCLMTIEIDCKKHNNLEGVNFSFFAALFSWIWHGMILAFGSVVLVGDWLGLTS